MRIEKIYNNRGAGTKIGKKEKNKKKNRKGRHGTKADGEVELEEESVSFEGRWCYLPEDTHTGILKLY